MNSSEGLKGALAGAGTGAMIGGPIGGLIGGAAGGLMGLFGESAEEKEKNRIAQAQSNINVDPRLFNLPGGAERSRYLQGIGTQAATRGSDLRGNQQDLLSQLQQQAAGQGPSLAAIQAQQAANTGIQQQRALAASAAPGQGALAQRMAMQQGGNITGSIVGQSAAARAQEQLGAQQNLAQALGQYRQQDIGQMAVNDQARNELLRQELQNAGMMQQGGIAQQGAYNQQLAAMLGQPQQVGTGDMLMATAAQAVPYFLK